MENKNYSALVVIGILLLLVFSVGQTFTIISHKQKMIPPVISSAGGSETYEEMMARMHPDQVVSGQQSGGQSGGMVGGC